MQLSKCPSCLYNTENGFYEPVVIVFQSGVKIEDECAMDIQGYPHAKQCKEYEVMPVVDGD